MFWMLLEETSLKPEETSLTEQDDEPSVPALLIERLHIPGVGLERVFACFDSGFHGVLKDFQVFFLRFS